MRLLVFSMPELEMAVSGRNTIAQKGRLVVRVPVLRSEEQVGLLAKLHGAARTSRLAAQGWP